MQLTAYNDAIKKHKEECRHMAFIDLDEYIMPETPFKKNSGNRKRNNIETSERGRYCAKLVFIRELRTYKTSKRTNN